MGMFDYLIIDKVHLPEPVKEYQSKKIDNYLSLFDFEENYNLWQTKSLENCLDLIEIDKNGKLFIFEPDETDHLGEKVVQTQFTGAIEFHTNIEGVYWKFATLFKKGQMIAIVQVEPDTETEEKKELPIKKKSVLELAKEIPKGKYAGITKMLEPHEIPKHERKAKKVKKKSNLIDKRVKLDNGKTIIVTISVL